MSTEASTRLNGTGYAAETVTKPPGWHGLVAWDLLFNNLTTGLFLAAALGDLLAPEEFTPVAKAAYPIALVFLVIDLACLVFDLGDPLRFHHMLRVFKPTSPMSLGTWCLTIYSLPLTWRRGLSLIERLSSSWSGTAVVPLLPRGQPRGVPATRGRAGARAAGWAVTHQLRLLWAGGLYTIRAHRARRRDGRHSPASRAQDSSLVGLAAIQRPATTPGQLWRLARWRSAGPRAPWA